MRTLLLPPFYPFSFGKTHISFLKPNHHLPLIHMMMSYMFITHIINVNVCFFSILFYFYVNLSTLKDKSLEGKIWKQFLCFAYIYTI